MANELNTANRRRIKKGVVVSNKMQKTVVVKVKRTVRHPKYAKIMLVTKKYYAHDESASERSIGDELTIIETRPTSKLKRWRVLENKTV